QRATPGSSSIGLRSYHYGAREADGQQAGRIPVADAAGNRGGAAVASRGCRPPLPVASGSLMAGKNAAPRAFGYWPNHNALTYNRIFQAGQRPQGGADARVGGNGARRQARRVPARGARAFQPGQ